LRTNEAIAALSIKDSNRIAKEYLYWYLTYFDWQKAAEGEDKVKGKTLNKDKLKRLPVLVPPLEEQRRIVAVLDEAFAAIATATANAEKNLANARELSAMLPSADSKENRRLAIRELLARGWLVGHMDGIRRFDALHDAPPVDAITAEMVREFRKVYSRLPSRVPDAIAELPLREQNLIAERDELPTLAPATVNKALSGLRVMLEHAVEEMQVIPGNVAKTVRGLQTDGEIDSRLPFTPEDMQLIFSRDLPRNKSGVSPETMAWMLLLGPYTGCRLEELGKLRPSNVRTERGIAFIAIERDRKVARDKERKEGKTGSKRSKTQAAYREIPLHPLLIEAGLLELVRRRRDEGAEWLFDDLTTDKYGSRTKRLSRVINDWFDAIGLSDPELVYHSFRHTVRRVLRGRADRDLVDLIAGHSDGSVGSKYGRGAALEPLRDAIGLIDYPEVDWLPVVTRARDSVRARLSSKQPA
jgi:integrase